MHSQAVYRAPELVAKSQLQTMSSLVTICTQQPFLIKWFSLQAKSSLSFVFLPQHSFWFAGSAAVLKGEHPYEQHPVNVLGSGRVSEKYLNAILDVCTCAGSGMDGPLDGVMY